MAESRRDEIAKLEQLFRENPEGRVFTHLAEAYRRAGEPERAHGILTDGLSRHADYASAHVVMGRVLLDLGRREDAAASFRRVLELDGHNLVALRALGDLARDDGLRDEALGYFRELRGLDPGSEELGEIVLELEGGAAPADTDADVAADAAVDADDVREFESAAADADSAPEAGFVAGDEGTDLVAALDGVELGSGIEDDSAEADTAARTGAGEDADWLVDVDVSVDEEALAGLAADGGEDEAEDPWPAHLDGTLELPAEDDFELPAEGEPDAPAGGDVDVPDLEVAPEAFGSIELTIPDLDADADAEEPAADAAERAAVEAPEAEADEEPSKAAADVAGSDDFLAVDAEHEVELEFLDEEPPEEREPAAGAELDAVEPAGEPEAGGDEDAFDGEVITETLAELYLAQGLSERAVEVYRELLRQRPDDERLRARLEEVEEQALRRGAASGWEVVAEEEERPQAAAGVDADDPWSEVDSAAAEAWAAEDSREESPVEEVEAAWTGGGGAVGDEEMLYAWSGGEDEEAEPDGGGETVGQYFGDLLGWKPARAVDAGAAGPAGDELDALFGSPAGGSSEDPAAEPGGEGGEADAGGSDEDDLEMFRAWLQSLKR